MSKVKKKWGCEKKEKKLSLEEEKKRLLEARNLFFNKLVEGERKHMIIKMVGKFKLLRYEDLEEVYNDGCLVLWVKMKDEDFELREENLVWYLTKICWNIGMHYLRKVKEDVMSLDVMMERGYGGKDEDENGLEEMFEVLSKKECDEEKYKKLEKVWDKLKDVERMILECYYVEGCKMEEIARRIGYKNGNSVKSKKNRVLRKMMKMMKEEGTENNALPPAA
ncbi:MAG: sigma-70 family RNA polymerase sigma factor [Prevotella sp.]|nr:sigma-70 family RNA polymerase sigma factor [Prevotella sp.]